MEKRPMLVEIPIKVKGYDVDAMGFVNNIVYVRWFEDIRHAFLDAYYPYEDMMHENKSPVLTQTIIEYKKPLTIFDAPTGRSWVESFGKTKWSMQFEIEQNGILHCKGSQTGFFYDIEKERAAPLPQSMRDAFDREKG